MQTRRQSGSVETTDIVERELRVVNGKIPSHTSFHFLSIGESFLKDKNEPSMKVFQESVTHLLVREAKRRDRILRISTGFLHKYEDHR